MTKSVLSRRDYLAGIATTSLLVTAGCTSPYGFGELNDVAEVIARDLTDNTPYEYSVDEDGNEDPGNEVYVGWNEGMLNVSTDAEFAESEFCAEEYPNKELQQDPERMEKEKNEAFLESYAKLINKFTREFAKDFCNESGDINWDKLVEFNSGREN